MLSFSDSDGVLKIFFFLLPICDYRVGKVNTKAIVPTRIYSAFLYFRPIMMSNEP